MECRSLTNDLENCLVEISAQLQTGTSLTDYHIIYRDSNQKWDGIAITELGNTETERYMLMARNMQGLQWRVQGFRIKFLPIQLPTYEGAVSSIVSGRMYRHFNLPVPRTHSLN